MLDPLVLALVVIVLCALHALHVARRLSVERNEHLIERAALFEREEELRDRVEAISRLLVKREMAALRGKEPPQSMNGSPRSQHFVLSHEAE
jgi:CHASE1-domain containing sensor protein